MKVCLFIWSNAFTLTNTFKVSLHRPGYGRLAAWLASDPNFAMGRNYADLRVRVRLHKQYKVEELKARLKELDDRQYERDPDLLTSIELDIKGEDGERDILIQELDVALREHGECIAISIFPSR